MLNTETTKNNLVPIDTSSVRDPCADGFKMIPFYVLCPPLSLSLYLSIYLQFIKEVTIKTYVLSKILTVRFTVLLDPILGGEWCCL